MHATTLPKILAATSLAVFALGATSVAQAGTGVKPSTTKKHPEIIGVLTGPQIIGVLKQRQIIGVLKHGTFITIRKAGGIPPGQ